MKRRTKKKYTDRELLLAMHVSASALYGSKIIEVLYSTLDWLEKFRNGRKRRLQAAFSETDIKRQLDKIYKKSIKADQKRQQTQQ